MSYHKNKKSNYSPSLATFKKGCENYVKNFYKKRGGKDPDAICNHLAGIVAAIKINNYAHGLPLDDKVTNELTEYLDKLWVEVCLENGLDPSVTTPQTVIKDFG